MSIFLRNKRGDSTYLGTAIGLLISVVLGALLYTGVTGMINGSVAKGIQSSFEVEEEQKQSISIAKGPVTDNYEFMIEDFEDTTEYIYSGMELVNRGGSGYSAEGIASNVGNSYKTSFYVKSELSIARFKAMLSRGSLENANITCDLERPIQSSSNIIVSLDVKYYPNLNDTDSSSSKTINGKIDGNTITFDLSQVAKDDDINTFIKGIFAFNIKVTEKIDSDATYLTYYIDNIKYVEN